MSWHIGQKVVVVLGHRIFPFKVGDILVVKGIRPNPCNCCKWQLDVGFFKSGGYNATLCGRCGNVTADPSSIWWFGDLCFEPLDELEGIDISELTDIIEIKEPAYA